MGNAEGKSQQPYDLDRLARLNVRVDSAAGEASTEIAAPALTESY
jgi:hypothetical protein